jgi:hypothetical protein
MGIKAIRPHQAGKVNCVIHKERDGNKGNPATSGWQGELYYSQRNKPLQSLKLYFRHAAKTGISDWRPASTILKFP